jgi:hypothetical protein
LISVLFSHVLQSESNTIFRYEHAPVNLSNANELFSLKSAVSHGKMMLSQSDSDSDVLFESRKCRQNGDARNGHGKIRNGFVKPGRRIKT